MVVSIATIHKKTFKIHYTLKKSDKNDDKKKTCRYYPIINYSKNIILITISNRMRIIINFYIYNVGVT